MLATMTQKTAAISLANTLGLVETTDILGIRPSCEHFPLDFNNNYYYYIVVYESYHRAVKTTTPSALHLIGRQEQHKRRGPRASQSTVNDVT